MIPEAGDHLGLTANHVCVQTMTREPGERCQSSFGAGLDDRNVAYECDSFEVSLSGATSVKRTSITWTNQPVVAHHTGHQHRVYRPV
jgi:hypothetical protein